jgi:hypothetical protein
MSDHKRPQGRLFFWFFSLSMIQTGQNGGYAFLVIGTPQQGWSQCVLKREQKLIDRLLSGFYPYSIKVLAGLAKNSFRSLILIKLLGEALLRKPILRGFYA